MDEHCRGCGGDLTAHQTVLIRGEAAELYRCAACGLCEFPSPTWLDSAYSDPISRIDVGLASRCVGLARTTEAIVRAEHLGHRRHLDYGGGYGLLTRLVRDRGLDMHHFDPFTDNLFAQGLEGSPDDDNGCVTLVEVFEHLTDPIEVVASLSKADIIIVSTLVVPTGMTDLSTWWYLIPEIGQHVTFWTVAALDKLGEKFGYRLTSDSNNLHVLHRAPLSRLSRAVIKDQRSAAVIGPLLRRRDHATPLGPVDATIARASVLPS